MAEFRNSMPVHRNNTRGAVSTRMHTMRMGGRVSLFNYNPSIAGGKISVKRFHRAHRAGTILRRNAQKFMPSIVGAEGAGNMNPGHSVGGLMGAAPVSSMHGANAHRQRVLDAIGKHLSGGGSTRKRR